MKRYFRRLASAPPRPFQCQQPRLRFLATYAGTATPPSETKPMYRNGRSIAEIQDVSIPGFKLGAYPASGQQTKPITQIRLPKFRTLEAEREHRKLHHAAALRWLGYNGYNNEGAGGHVTVRDPIMTDHFWINPHGKSFRYMKPEDLCLMSETGEVVEGGNMHTVNPAGYAIHNALHKARPDVIAAVHCHSVPSKAFASLGCELEPISQDACRYAKGSPRLWLLLICSKLLSRSRSL